MKLPVISTLYNYNYAVHSNVWDCIDHITDEQFVQDVNYSLGSIRNHYVHLINVDSRWMSRMQGTPLPDRVLESDFTTKALTRARWEQVASNMLQFVGTLREDDLDRVIDYDLPHRGGWKHDPMWQILVHVVNHGSDHRAQILPILHGLGAPTLEQDLMIYLWGREGT